MASKHSFPVKSIRFPPFNSHSITSSTNNGTKLPQMALQNITISKRRVLTIAIVSTFLYNKFQNTKFIAANAFDLRLVAPEQTLEEAENGVKSHAQSLLKIKELLEEEDSLKAAQRELRKNSSYLKQDLYTIIQNKPGIMRAELRKLYSDLFNSVTRLDYAARDKDVPRIWECYNNMVAALDRIFVKIS